jgi:hypothetical protein
VYFFDVNVGRYFWYKAILKQYCYLGLQLIKWIDRLTNVALNFLTCLDFKMAAGGSIEKGSPTSHSTLVSRSLKYTALNVKL